MTSESEQIKVYQDLAGVGAILQKLFVVVWTFESLQGRQSSNRVSVNLAPNPF